jgi:hypothetical protein
MGLVGEDNKAHAPTYAFHLVRAAEVNAEQRAIGTEREYTFTVKSGGGG